MHINKINKNQNLDYKENLFIPEYQSIEFQGYASIFNVIDSYRDVILPGAFADIEDPATIKVLWQHESLDPIGYLTFAKEDENGFFVKGIIIDTEIGKKALKLITSNVISSLSIGFSIINSYFDNTSNVQYIEKVKLFEVSLVTFPANNLTSVGLIGDQNL